MTGSTAAAVRKGNSKVAQSGIDMSSFLGDVLHEIKGAASNPDVLPTKEATAESAETWAPDSLEAPANLNESPIHAADTPGKVEMQAPAPQVPMPQTLQKAVQAHFATSEAPVAHDRPSVVAPSNAMEGQGTVVSDRVSAPIADAPKAVHPQLHANVGHASPDAMSLSAPERTMGRPKIFEEKALNRSVVLEESVVKRINRLANKEGLDLDTRINASEVMRHLIMYALSHIEDDKVIPRPDGSGLHLK